MPQLEIDHLIWRLHFPLSVMHVRNHFDVADPSSNGEVGGRHSPRGLHCTAAEP